MLLPMHTPVERKVARRLIPFMFLLYVVSYLDRINVGFAALHMNADLGIGSAAFGLGAGIFFIGYTLFEVPSNLLMHRFGPRVWIARIMITWGMVSAAMMLVQGVASFYALRFLLGLAEAGFFPGMILYLTYWFPSRARAQAVALFMTATAIAGVIGGPVSGALLQMKGLGGLQGWQWMFLLEGLPAVLLGLVVLVYLPATPAEASWLTPDERTELEALMVEDRAQHPVADSHSIRPALASGRVWLLAVLYCTIVVAMYGIAFWLPQIIKGFSGLGDFRVGLVSAIPYIAAALMMLVNARHSDRTGERQRHVAVALLAGSVGLVLAAGVSSPVLSLAALSLGAVGIWSSLGPFWALPTSLLGGRSAAAGIALVNSVGNIGGFLGPYAVGLARTETGSYAAGLLLLAGVLLTGAILALGIPRTK